MDLAGNLHAGSRLSTANLCLFDRAIARSINGSRSARFFQPVATLVDRGDVAHLRTLVDAAAGFLTKASRRAQCSISIDKFYHAAEYLLRQRTGIPQTLSRQH